MCNEVELLDAAFDGEAYPEIDEALLAEVGLTLKADLTALLAEYGVTV